MDVFFDEIYLYFASYDYIEGSEKLKKIKLSKIKVLLIEQIYIKTITK